MDDIGLWELNEAFAVQVIYCRDELGIPNELLNVNGGAISIGHPYGMSGARMVGHALIEGKRRDAKYVVCTCALAGAWVLPDFSKFTKAACSVGASAPTVAAAREPRMTQQLTRSLCIRLFSRYC